MRPDHASTVSVREMFFKTPLHQVNGLAAIWEWGSPVNSGLRGEGGNRTHIAGFSVQCLDQLGNLSNLL